MVRLVFCCRWTYLRHQSSSDWWSVPCLVPAMLILPEPRQMRSGIQDTTRAMSGSADWLPLGGHRAGQASARSLRRSVFRVIPRSRAAWSLLPSSDPLERLLQQPQDLGLRGQRAACRRGCDAGGVPTSRAGGGLPFGLCTSPGPTPFRNSVHSLGRRLEGQAASFRFSLKRRS